MSDSRSKGTMPTSASSAFKPIKSQCISGKTTYKGQLIVQSDATKNVFRPAFWEGESGEQKEPIRKLLNDPKYEYLCNAEGIVKTQEREQAAPAEQHLPRGVRKLRHEAQARAASHRETPRSRWSSQLPQYFSTLGLGP